MTDHAQTIETIIRDWLGDYVSHLPPTSEVSRTIANALRSPPIGTPDNAREQDCLRCGRPFNKYCDICGARAAAEPGGVDPAQQTGMLIAEWKAEARKHIAAALEDDAEVGGDEWFLHRESARIYDSCAKQLAALSPHPSTERGAP